VGHKSSVGTESSVLPALSLVATPTSASRRLEVRCNISAEAFYQEFHRTLHWGEEWTEMHKVQ
jgi:hypothetical protein